MRLFLLKAEGQNTFCYETSRRKERGKLIQMTTGYFLNWRTTYHSFQGPLLFPRWPLSQISHPRDVKDVKIPTCVHFTGSNFRGLPLAPILGQTIDRCTTLPLADSPKLNNCQTATGKPVCSARSHANYARSRNSAVRTWALGYHMLKNEIPYFLPVIFCGYRINDMKIKTTKTIIESNEKKPSQLNDKAR